MSNLRRPVPNWVSVLVVGLSIALSSVYVWATTPPLRVNGITSSMTLDTTPNNATYTAGSVSGGSGYQNFISMAPAEAGAASWYEGLSATLFHGTRKDQVVTKGWNFQPNGVRVSTSDAAIGDQWESYYEADATHKWVERHIVFIGSDGTYQRPMTMQVETRVGDANPIGYTNFGIGADNIQFTPSTYSCSANANIAIINPAACTAAQLQINNSSIVRINTNNIQSLTQVNQAGNAAYSLAYVNSANTVQLADAGTTSQVNGTNIFVSPSSMFQMLADTAVALIYGSPTATSGTTKKNSPSMYLRGSYWNGTASTTVDNSLTNVVDSTAPTSHLQFNVGATAVNMNSDGTITFTGIAFASLPSSANGSLAYCSNCTVANPCASGGTGAIAKRLNGSWVCN